FQQPKVEGYGPKTSNSVSENISNKIKESPDAPLVKELVLDDKLDFKDVYLVKEHKFNHFSVSQIYPLGKFDGKNDERYFVGYSVNNKEPRVNQKKDANVNITNNINTVSPSANVASIMDNVVDKDIVYGCADDPNMPNLEEINYSDDDEDVGAEADMTNLNSYILSCLIITLPLPSPSTSSYIRSIRSRDDGSQPCDLQEETKVTKFLLLSLFEQQHVPPRRQEEE
nr:hypothetical protein [Tanacetum cinerariifolium]